MKYGEKTAPEMEPLAAEVVDAAFKVHNELGPGSWNPSLRLAWLYE